jgi:integrase
MTVRTEVRRGGRRYVIDIPYTKPDGTRARFRHDAEVQNLAAARAEERRRLALLASTGSPSEASAVVALDAPDDIVCDLTVAELAPKFLDAYGSTRLKPSTKRSYRVIIERFLVPRIGERVLSGLDAGVMRELDRELVKRGSKPSTRRNMQVVVRSMCTYAVEARLLSEVPRFPPLPRSGATIQMAMSAEDVDAILNATPEPYRLAFELAAFAGLRAGEVRGLRWKDVDFRGSMLVVRRSICRGVDAPPKSGHERMIPLHPELRASLKALKRGEPLEPVSGPERGSLWGEFALGQSFKRYSAKAGIVGFRFHDLRHAFVTGLFRSGAPAPVVQSLAGHLHLSTTQRYAHVRREELSEAMQRFGGNRTATARTSDPERRKASPTKR